MKLYNYAILVTNAPERYLHQESTYLPSPFKKTKYALIEKQCFNDGSEGINRIIYSDDLDALTLQLKTYISWYDYIAGFMKNIQGYISSTFVCAPYAQQEDDALKQKFIKH